MIGDFKTLGYSIFEIGDSTGEIINQVKSLGVNTNSVFEMINKNVGQLNLYNFSDGINGMAKMAADPKTQQWWDVCMPLQRPLNDRADGEWWASIPEVFHVD